VQDIGEKAKKSMKNKIEKKIEYTDEPMDQLEVISDFLPSPDELAFKEETVKVTISLSKSSVDFFKKQALSHRTQYQKMIRRLLDEYVIKQEQTPQKAIR
jgi:predicted DNA binding CopG/RHH family protein